MHPAIEPVGTPRLFCHSACELVSFAKSSNDAQQSEYVQIMGSSESDSVSTAGTGKLPRYRIFLASPGDVPLERKLAREAIEHISNERRFRGRIDIDIVAWDQPGAAVAMEAGLTPQQAIAQGLPKPEDCDLTVIVLWSRIGTRLPDDFELKEDGTPYLSGTEWEYVNALKAYQRNGKPAVWVYRRRGAPQFAVNDPELAAKQDQWQKLETFFTSFTNPDGSLAGGINNYEAPDDFRQQFEHHLRDRLDKLLETLPEARVVQASSERGPTWAGSPYPGLAAFMPEQAPIFFGRGAEIDQLLQQFANSHVKFVAVVGVSGSGKSSLVKAGLLPRLRAGIVGNAPWIDLSFRPDERGGNPLLALAFELKSALHIADQTEKEIARAIQADTAVAQNHLVELLAQHETASELLLFIDQFEELFTRSMADQRRDFLKLLEHLVKLPCIRVIVTMRADFYARAIEEPVLAGLLRRDHGTFPLDPPGISALLQMIIRPAEAAGVELEDGLAQRLLDESGEGPGAMPLIAFTLHQLYEQERASGVISIQAYETSGGVHGAVQQRAESAMQGLPIDYDTVLPELFVLLVEVNEQEVATRRRAPQALLEGDVKTAADALVEARLLVTGKGENNQPMLEFAHETVLNGWERLKLWIRDHAERLRARRDLERAAAEWKKSGRDKGCLRTGRLLQRYLDSTAPRSELADDYLAACKSRQLRFRIGVAVLGLLAVGLFTILFKVNQSQYPPLFATKALMVQLGVWPVSRPVMAKIPTGKFEMGDVIGDGDSDEYPVHTVQFEYAFEIGKYEVTFEEYDLFAAATGREKPNHEGWGRDGRPVINVSWDDAVAYTEWLSDRTGSVYRLLSEAEWEYAARAGTTTSRYWPDNQLGRQDAACAYANVFDSNNEARIKRTYGVSWEPFDCVDDFAFTAPVGSPVFKPNKWRLHDMLGNVWEWTRDCYVDNYDGAPNDGSARETGAEGKCPLRLLRGGSWINDARSVRSSNRYGYTPQDRNHNVGFRLARTL